MHPPHPLPAAGAAGRALACLAVAALLAAAAAVGRSRGDEEQGAAAPTRIYAFSARSGERLFPHARFERCFLVSTDAPDDRPARLEPFDAHEGLLLDDRVVGVVLVPERGATICLVPAFGADPRRRPRPALFARDGPDEPFRLLIAPSIDLTRVADPAGVELTVETERGRVVPAPLGMLVATRSRRLLLELPELPREDAALVEAIRYGWGRLSDASGQRIGSVALPAEVIVVEGVDLKADRRTEGAPNALRVITRGHFSAARLSVRVTVEPPARFEPARADGRYVLERAGRVAVGEVSSEQSGEVEIDASVRVDHADEAVARRRAAVEEALERVAERPAAPGAGTRP